MRSDDKNEHESYSSYCLVCSVWPQTPDNCILDVQVGCKLEDGSPCDTKQSPDGICAIGTELSVVTFSYKPDCDCSESKNMQEGIAVCEDIAPLGDGPAAVSCVDPSSGTTLAVEPTVVDPDDTFTVKSASGGQLPQTVECTLTSAETGATVQVNLIDVSGDVTLNLKDKFGALRLETCDEQMCIEEACFEVRTCSVAVDPLCSLS